VLTPVHYNPVREKVYYYDKITISVETENISPAQQVAAYIGTPFSKSRIYQIVDNKEAVNNLPITPKDGNDYEFLIITAPNIASGWTALVDFNKRRGMRTLIKSVAEIQSMTGTDLPDKIRNYIKAEYEAHKIVFAVLGGDVTTNTDNIPARQLYAKYYDHNITPDRLNEQYPAADMYYGTLDGTWNTNNDTKFGEPGEEDLYWEVFVSRYPCDNTTHLTNLINKTVKYSEQPVRESACNFLGLGEFLWDDYGVTVWGAGIVDLYIGVKDDYGFTTHGVPGDFAITRLDDRQFNKENAWGAAELTTTFGQSKAAWVVHEGQNSSSGAFGISSSSIEKCFNNDGTSHNYFIGLTAACSAGQFHKTDSCFLERMANSAKTCVGVIGNNEFGYADDDGYDSPGARPFRYIFDAIFNPQKRVHFHEAMHAMGKEANIDIAVDPNALSNAPYYGIIRYCCYNTNLFGDPAVSVWTKNPQDLTQPFEYTADGAQFTMKTPPYTSVALANAAGEIFTTQLTGYKAPANNSFTPGDSTCLINDNAYKTYAAANSTMKVYIKAHNYIAKAFDVPISSAIVAKIPANNYSIKHAGGKVFFNLPADGFVNLSIYNQKGALVKNLVNGMLKAGIHQVNLDNASTGSGVFYCSMMANADKQTVPFIVVK